MAEGKYIFNQFRGLGDILFIMRIAQDVIAEGGEVIIPVEPHYVSIGKHFPGVKIVDMKSFNLDYDIRQVYHIDDYKVVPFRFANDILQVPYTDCMKAKYWYWDNLKGTTKSVGSDSWERWRDYRIERDLENELKLFNKLNPNNEPYIFVNRNFRTTFTGKAKIQAPRDIKVIEMSEMKGFTLIDWSLILERAQEIHTVGTSINYLIEKLKINSPIHLYKRLPEENHYDNYSYILDTENKNYIFH